VTDRLIKFLRCSSCLGAMIFHKVNAPEVFEKTGILVCSKCGKSAIMIKGIPIFRIFFDDLASASRVLAEIVDGEPRVRQLLTQLLGRTENPVLKLANLLNFLDNASLVEVFDFFKTSYINLHRFSSRKYVEIQQFLAQKPVETLLDIGCGFGCSSVSFTLRKKADYCVGLDEKLLFLFLFQKYCSHQGIQNVDLVCFDASKQPFPFRSASFELTIAISFFNHFLSTRSRENVNSFFNELHRVSRLNAEVYIDAVPNRMTPIPGEINTSLIVQKGFRRHLAEIVARYIPTKWFPRSVSLNLYWLFYKFYCASARTKMESYETFLNYASAIVPEIDVNALPVFPSSYVRFLSNFNKVSVIPQTKFYQKHPYAEEKWTTRDFLGSPYLILLCEK